MGIPYEYSYEYLLQGLIERTVRERPNDTVLVSLPPCSRIPYSTRISTPLLVSPVSCRVSTVQYCTRTVLYSSTCRADLVGTCRYYLVATRYLYTNVAIPFNPRDLGTSTSTRLYSYRYRNIIHGRRGAGSRAEGRGREEDTIGADPSTENPNPNP